MVRQPRGGGDEWPWEESLGGGENARTVLPDGENALPRGGPWGLTNEELFYLGSAGYTSSAVHDLGVDVLKGLAHMKLHSEQVVPSLTSWKHETRATRSLGYAVDSPTTASPGVALGYGDASLSDHEWGGAEDPANNNFDAKTMHRVNRVPHGYSLGGSKLAYHLGRLHLRAEQVQDLSSTVLHQLALGEYKFSQNLRALNASELHHLGNALFYPTTVLDLEFDVIQRLARVELTGAQTLSLNYAGAHADYDRVHDMHSPGVLNAHRLALTYAHDPYLNESARLHVLNPPDWSLSQALVNDTVAHARLNLPHGGSVGTLPRVDAPDDGHGSETSWTGTGYVTARLPSS